MLFFIPPSINNSISSVFQWKSYMGEIMPFYLFSFILSNPINAHWVWIWGSLKNTPKVRWPFLHFFPLVYFYISNILLTISFTVHTESTASTKIFFKVAAIKAAVWSTRCQKIVKNVLHSLSKPKGDIFKCLGLFDKLLKTENISVCNGLKPTSTKQSQLL